MKQWSGARKIERHGIAFLLLIMILLVSTCFVHFSGSAGHAAQTRDQCDRCCDKSGYDEYYTEQCKLKCFRNTDHCSGKGVQSAAPETTAPPQSTAPPRKDQPKVATPPAGEQKTAPPASTQRKPAFRFPQSLSLVPGREQEAAVQLLAANGIPPQHPNYARGLAAIQNILVEFAKANPSGGSLPTAQLERVIRQLRQ